MQESGAALLRAMQNESMMRLDLLVRESIQNVLDAAIEGPGGEVRVDYLFRTHATNTIGSLLGDGIDRRVLLSRFPEGGQLLEIRDSRTVGLTGPLSLDEIEHGKDHGNLLKLVYEIGRTRDTEGAGGSWGLGKTCYFRMGIGLVFYYSRIRTGDDFAERLVACLVEDQDSSERLQHDTRTGIGWWGGDGLRPVTRASQIRDILSQLGIRRFSGEETGTAIIIPFLRDDLIPPPDSLSGDDRPSVQAPVTWWSDSYEEFVGVAAQRWFCTRLDNPHFATGPRLSVFVNGEILRAADMLPVFQVVQALYNRTLENPPACDYFSGAGVPAEALLKKQVSLRNTFHTGEKAGNVVGALLTAEQLGMTAPENHPDPYLCLFGRSEGTAPFSPIVTFIRHPGMSICWDSSTDSRSWSGGLNGSADGRYLIALFVPAQNRRLAADTCASLHKPDATLEYYLRSCERADHHAWSDISGQTIVNRIRYHTGKQIKDFGSVQVQAAAVAPAMRMARNVADLLMPQRGPGGDGRNGRGSPDRPGGRHGGAGSRRRFSGKPVLKIGAINYQQGGVLVSWELNWGSESTATPRQIILQVSSESGEISEADWTESGLGIFPFQIDSVIVEPGKFGSASIITVSDGVSSVLLNPKDSGGPVDPVRGMLAIALRSAAAGMLLPSLSVLVCPRNVAS